MNKELSPLQGRRAINLAPSPISAVRSGVVPAKMTVLGSLPKLASNSPKKATGNINVQLKDGSMAPPGDSSSSTLDHSRISQLKMELVIWLMLLLLLHLKMVMVFWLMLLLLLLG